MIFVALNAHEIWVPPSVNDLMESTVHSIVNKSQYWPRNADKHVLPPKMKRCMPDGRTDPLIEVLSTLKAVTSKANEHPWHACNLLTISL